jgi:outer membrane protein TolC
MKSILMVPLLLAACGVSRVIQAAPAPASTNALALDPVVREVLANNPALKSARANWEAMKWRIPQARAWDDPRIGVDVERSGTTRFTSYHDTEWMLSQSVPLSGKNRLRGRATAAEAAAAFSVWRRGELDLTARARSAYHRLANAHAQLAINQDTAGLLRQLVETTRIKYEAGTRQQADVFMAEMELAKNQESRRDIERELSDAQSRLNVLLHRPARSPLGVPAPNVLREPELRPEAVEALALAQRPELLGAHKKIEAATAQQDLAKRAWIPDPELRVEARQFRNSGFTEYDTAIFFNIPWVNPGKYKAASAEARLHRESAEQDLETLRAETAGAVRDQLQKIETLHHHVALFRDRLLPLAQQTVEATRVSYENGRSSLLELLSALRTQRDTEATLQQHLADYLAALAELEAIVGVDSEHLTPSTP